MSKDFSIEEVLKFKSEVESMIDSAEQGFHAIKLGVDFRTAYVPIFRSFHNIKGASALLRMSDLHTHAHFLQGRLLDARLDHGLHTEQIDFFLENTDAARDLLHGRRPPPAYAPAEDTTKTLWKPSSLRVPKIKEIGRIVLIDDEQDLVHALTKVLRTVGYDVRGLSYPTEAAQAIKEFSPDVILTDYSMPKMDGLEILQLVKKMNPNLAVILLSAHIDKEFLMKALRYGAFRVFEKPFDVLQVIECCHSAAQSVKMSRLLQNLKPAP